MDGFLKHIKYIRNRKKGQVWTTDFFIGIMLFVFMIFFAVKLFVSINESKDYDILYRDTVHLSSNLINPGYPANWNSSVVVLPGIAENNRINESKFNELNTLGYSRTKALFLLSNEYIFFFENSTGIINITIDELGTTKCMFGYPIQINSTCHPMLDTIQYDNFVKIKRVVIYNSTLVNLVVYGWN